MSDELKSVYINCGIEPDKLVIKDVRLKKERGELTLFVEKSPELEETRLPEWESALRGTLSGYELCFSYSEKAEEARSVKLTQGSPKEDRTVEAELPADGILYGKGEYPEYVHDIIELCETTENPHIKGRILSAEVREVRGKFREVEGYRLRFNVADDSGAIWCSAQYEEEWCAQRLGYWLTSLQKKNLVAELCGKLRLYKKYNELYFTAERIRTAPKLQRQDEEPEKRVELHLHTKMSAKDALCSTSEVIKTAKRWGHKAIAITDHGVVQSFPEAYKAAASTGVKVLYGVEGYLLPDSVTIPLPADFCVFDIETTGLKAESCDILEIGAVRYHNGVESGRFHSFINDSVVIPSNITALTGITEDMLHGAPPTREVLRDFYEFSRGCCFVAHNAAFDTGFITFHGARYGIEFDNDYADTLMLSRALLRDEVINHKLDTLCEYLNIDMGSHHRAVDDAKSCATVFFILLDMLKARRLTTLPVVTRSIAAKSPKDRRRTFHVIILAKTQEGMKALYKLISYSHLDYFHARPQIPKSLLSVYREDLIIGSACAAGELYGAIVNGLSQERIESIAGFYDFLEVQPLCNNAFLVREGKLADDEAIRNVNRRIVELGRSLNIPVAATGDVHFQEPEDAVYRKILLYKEGYTDAEFQPPLYLKTTREMLDEFSYLGEDKARELVITVPNMIADSCDVLKAFPDGTHAPKIPDAEKILSDMAYGKAHDIYGDPLPEAVSSRLERELASIVGNGFASLYLLAQRLVAKSLSDGYIVGSRGSVGSSFVATMAGISEVNALSPHYTCPKCKYSDFEVDRKLYKTGFDMPDRDCPVCGTKLVKRGFDIFFEVFLGFKGDKTPDIDLNFSGEYQPVAHRYVEEMFGRGHAFRAGTISGIADKKAFECVMHYAEATGRTVSSAEAERLKQGILNVKQTTGQHPGGIVVVPKEDDIYDYTPVQHPADKADKNTITTHFDFHALDDRLVKLDILGHDDPTALRMLEDLTGISPHDIPIGDPETLALFSSSEQLGVDLSALECSVGTIGVPEFGTGFVRQVLELTRPSTIEELVRIAGLTHGENVWLGNAEALIREGTAKLSQVIGARDDIMGYLIECGMEPRLSFTIMERVRKGKGLTDEMDAAMHESKVPEWFIESCRRIKYLFPRGHAAAYVVMAFSVAYFKRHYPKEFYAVYYTVRADAFDIMQARGGAETVLANIKALNVADASVKDKDLVTILEVVYEMNLRGIELLPVDIYKSDAVKFKVEGEALRPPFNSVSGVGDNAALAIVEKRGSTRFTSIQDFAEATGANSGVIERLSACGCFEGMPRRNQISLFDMI